MGHDAAIVGSMPMGGARRCPDDITCLDATWLGALVADPSGACYYLQELPLLMGMPMRSRAGSEGYVGDGHLVILVDLVEVYIASEGISGLGGGLAALCGAGEDYRL